jgi:hypothetical protein
MLNQIITTLETILVVFVKRHLKLKSTLKTIFVSIQGKGLLVVRFVVTTSVTKLLWLLIKEAMRA